MLKMLLSALWNVTVRDFPVIPGIALQPTAAAERDGWMKTTRNGKSDVLAG